MKLAGFLAGAGVAGIAVFAFNAWRTVTDDDLLSAILQDHCLPYVQTGATPFEGMGRAPGVFDGVETRDNLQDGNTVLIHDNRFVAQWGILPGEDDGFVPVRLCTVTATVDDTTASAFTVAPNGFVARYTDVIATAEALVPEEATLTSGPRSFVWTGAGRGLDEGLRVIMIASPGFVSSVLVVTDLP